MASQRQTAVSSHGHAPAPGGANDAALVPSTGLRQSPSTGGAVHVLQALARHSLPNDRGAALPSKKIEPADAASVPSIGLLPVADHARVFREYEQRSSLYSHTDVARALWSQMSIACSVGIIKQNLLAAFDGERAMMQEARQQALHSAVACDVSALDRNSLSPLAEALIHSLLLASNRISRVTVSLFGHALCASDAPRQLLPPVRALPAYDTRHSAQQVQLTAVPPAAIAAGGLPGIVQPHELLQWQGGQDLQVQASLCPAPWGCCLGCCDVPPSASPAEHAQQAAAAIRQWADAREDALTELSRTEAELQAEQGHSVSVPVDSAGACIGCVVIHSDGRAPLTLYDVILAQHAARFAAPLLAATACAAANDLFALASSLFAGPTLHSVVDAPSIPHAIGAIRAAVGCIFREDSVTVSFFSDAFATTLHCCERPLPLEVPAAATGLLCFARDVQLPLLVTNPLLDPRYNPAVDVSPAFLPAASSGSSCSLLIVPCVGRAHPSAATTTVLGFIQIARLHSAALAPCCFSAVELRCIAKLAASAASLMKLIPQRHSSASTASLHPDSSSASVGSRARSSCDALSSSPGAAASSKRTDDAPPPPLASALLNILGNHRDVALQLFRALDGPRADPRLRRIAQLALAHADAPSAALLQLSTKTNAASTSRIPLDGSRRAWRSYVARAVRDFVQHRGDQDVQDADVLQAVSEAALGQDNAVLHFLISALRRKLEKVLSAPPLPAAGSASAQTRVAASAPPAQSSADADSVTRSLQQRADALQAQLALAEAAVRDAARRQASTHSLYDAAQAEVCSLSSALAEQAREHAAKVRALEEQERSAASAAQEACAALCCLSTTLTQLACLPSRVLHTQHARQAITSFDANLSSSVCEAMAALLPDGCSALAAAIIIGPPAPRSTQLAPAAGIAALAFQRQRDFILLDPHAHALYNADIDAHRSSPPPTAADAQARRALLCAYVHPAPSQPPGASCEVAGVLQLLLQLPASGSTSSTLCSLDGSDGSLPAAFTASQLRCIRTLACSVVSGVILSCLRLPDSDSERSPPLPPNSALQRQGVSLIALAEDVFALDVTSPKAASQSRLSPAAQAPSKSSVAARRNAAPPATAGSHAPPKQRLLPRRAKSPVAAREFSPELSLRAHLRSASPRSAPATSSPPDAAADWRQGADSRRSPTGSVYVQDRGESAAGRRPASSFLIPMCESGSGSGED